MSHSCIQRNRPAKSSISALFAAAGLLALTSCAEEGSSSHLADWLGVDVLGMIASSDAVGKICLVILLVFSIVTWGIIIYKFFHLQSAVRQTNRFVNECMAGSGNLEDAYKNTAAYPDSPLAQILREGYLELEIEDWYKLGYQLSNEQRVDVAKAGVERVFERTISNEMTHLESQLIFLAVASNVCPFIGLFGTVWGIMSTFQGLGIEGSATLSVLAPGIATALITTVAGLAAAIPASVMYNYFTAKVQVLTSRMDSFALELSNIIQKQLLKHEV
ncbi:MotA/TolQ/ExbB proton channel family protein [bacterium]|nr:MotA/TolQ/ExbB proton channel family protein [bacterium]